MLLLQTPLSPASILQARVSKHPYPLPYITGQGAHTVDVNKQPALKAKLSLLCKTHWNVASSLHDNIKG